MSTRAIYTFVDNRFGRKVHVYKHHDGYPSGAADALAAAAQLAWRAPRFEADEFAASFVAANKKSEGGVRLIGTALDGRAILPEEFASDTEFLYEIDGPNHVIAFYADGDGRREGKAFFDGTFEDLKTHQS